MMSDHSSDLAMELTRRYNRQMAAFDSNWRWEEIRDKLDKLYERYWTCSGEQRLKLWHNDIAPLEKNLARMARDQASGLGTMATDPLTDKGEKIKASMEKEYGPDKGERVFYASKNKGTISGVDSVAQDGKRGRWGGRPAKGQI